MGSREAGVDDSAARMDLLRHDGTDGVDGEASESADHTRVGAGTVSHCKPVWIVCDHDARPVRDRIPRLGRWAEVVGVSIPVQAAGSGEGAGNLRAVSATV